MKKAETNSDLMIQKKEKVIKNTFIELRKKTRKNHRERAV